MRLILYLNTSVWLGIVGLVAFALNWAADLPSSDVPLDILGLYFGICLLTGVMIWRKYG